MKKTALLTLLCVSLLAGCAANSNAPSAQSQSSASVKETANETATAVQEAQTGDAVEDAISAYASFLEGEIEDLQDNVRTAEKDVRYALIHLDDDEIPELAVPLGNSHSMGVGFFSYDGKEVKRLYVTGSFGIAYYERNSGVALGFYSGMGIYYTDIGVIEDGTLTDEVRMQLTDIEAAREARAFDGDGSGYYYAIREGDEISKEEYEALLEPYLPEKRDYRRLEYEDLPRIQDTDDVKEALRQSLKNEDDLPKMTSGSGWFYPPAEAAVPEELKAYYET